MDRQELQDKYESGELDDPVVIQEHRDDIHRFTGLKPPRSMAEIEEWWPDNKSVFSRRIKPSDLSEEESDEEDDNNEGDNE